MSRFTHCLEIVLGEEGGYVDHKADRGGKTNYGVTQATYSAYLKRLGLPDRSVSEIHASEVESIYGQYWKDAHCSYLFEPLDLYVFDCAINSGAGRALKLLQRTLGIDEDGICGKNTLAALHEEVIAVGVEQLAQAYLAVREEYYEAIVRKDPSQQVFLAGWKNRLDHLRDLA